MPIYNTGGGLSYPFKVGDTYVSNSGPIDAENDLPHDGQMYNVSDYTIAGLAGFPISSDPTGVEATGVLVDTLGTFSSQYNIVNNSNTAMVAAASDYFYSTDGLNFTPSAISNSKTFGIMPYDANYIVSVGNVNIKVYDPVNDLQIAFRSGSAGYGDARKCDFIGLSSNLVLAGAFTSTTLWFTAPGDITNKTDNVDTIVPSGNSTGVITSVSGLNDYFFVGFRTADVVNVTRTADFITFEDVSVPLSGAAAIGDEIRLCATGNTLYAYNSTRGYLHYSVDSGSTWVLSNNAFSLDISSGLHRVHGTEDAITFLTGSKTYISFDKGITNVQLGTIQTYATSYFNSSGYVYYSNGTNSTQLYGKQAILPLVQQFTTPVDITSPQGHLRYSKGNE